MQEPAWPISRSLPPLSSLRVYSGKSHRVLCVQQKGEQSPKVWQETDRFQPLVPWLCHQLLQVLWLSKENKTEHKKWPTNIWSLSTIFENWSNCPRLIDFEESTAGSWMCCAMEQCPAVPWLGSGLLGVMLHWHRDTKTVFPVGDAGWAKLNRPSYAQTSLFPSQAVDKPLERSMWAVTWLKLNPRQTAVRGFPKLAVVPGPLCSAASDGCVLSDFI